MTEDILSTENVVGTEAPTIELDMRFLSMMGEPLPARPEVQRAMLDLIMSREVPTLPEHLIIASSNSSNSYEAS